MHRYGILGLQLAIGAFLQLKPHYTIISCVTALPAGIAAASHRLESVCSESSCPTFDSGADHVWNETRRTWVGGLDFRFCGLPRFTPAAAPAGMWGLPSSL